MDMKKINNLLNDKFDDDDLNEEDLEDELEAILSGRAPIKAPSRSSVAQVQQERQSRSAARRAPPPPAAPAKASNRNVGANKRGGQPVNATTSSSNQENYFAQLSQPPPPAPSAFSSVPLKPQVFMPPAPSSRAPPPPVRIPEPDYNTAATPALPPRPEAPRAAPPNSNAQKIAQIKQLQIEYKRAALKAKTDQDKTAALAHFKVSKQLDAMIESLNANQDVDMSTLPPMPPQSSGSSAPAAAAASSSAPAAGPSSTSASAQQPEAFDVPEITQDDASKLFNAPKSANTVLEALQQRLDKFKSTLKEATDEQNASKARRLGRVVKQVEGAIKDYKAGKPVDFDSIPCPPGFPDIPQPSQQSESKPAAPAPAPPQPKPEGEAPRRVLPSSQPSAAAAVAAAAAVSHPKPPLKRGLSTTGSKQLKWLLERQRLFREAALEAKKRNEVEQAKEYLRHAKGFDPLIEATKNGLPIDATSVPTPPQLNSEDDFVVVNSQTVPATIASRAQVAEGSTFYTDLERDELFRNIEKELLDQIDMCNRNKEYFAKMGDINTSSKFEKYATEGSKDLNMLRVRWHNGDNIPTYRTETRTFSIVVSNFDVGINELQVDVVKALDLPGKAEIDTYIRVEVPLPSSEAPQRKKTKTVYDTINPEFNESIKFEIDRKSRSLTRILKRHPIKLEVFVKGYFIGCIPSGLFKSDACLGTVQLKVGDILEKQCTIHQSVQLMEGRKTLHGRLEFKVKLREPLLAKQIEEIKEKWIVFT
ncbi:Coiled-coil and C2 domain-containing protein 1A [Tyrophagus putrescentiae]|nr:Coiled-coil and C2 domain-containing protein 1A [Tyrophagus putrescentiae]